MKSTHIHKSKEKPSPLTPKEKQVLEFIEVYFLENEFAPTFLEIKDHFDFASFNSVQRYLKQLQKKNYISIPGGNQKRALTLLTPSHSLHTNYKNIYENSFAAAPKEKRGSVSSANGSESLSLPLMGRVAAGRPIEAVASHEFVDAPASLIAYPSKSFALTVEGDSMIEDGIHDGDIIFVQQQSQASNGSIVVALVENEATVKRFYHHKERAQIELRPANSLMQPLWYSPKEVRIEGIVVGLIRKF